MTCNKCQYWTCEAAFLPDPRTHLSTTFRACAHCEDTRACIVCRTHTSKHALTERARKSTFKHITNCKCKACTEKTRLMDISRMKHSFIHEGLQGFGFIIRTFKQWAYTARCNLCTHKTAAEGTEFARLMYFNYLYLLLNDLYLCFHDLDL